MACKAFSLGSCRGRSFMKTDTLFCEERHVEVPFVTAWWYAWGVQYLMSKGGPN